MTCKWKASATALAALCAFVMSGQGAKAHWRDRRHHHRLTIVLPGEGPVGHSPDRLSVQAIGAPLELHPLLHVASRYIGSPRFTRWQRAWCADALNAWLAQAGLPTSGSGRAIDFAHYGRPTTPHVGAIAVMPHHVGIVVGRNARGIVLLSGNHSHRVGVGTYADHLIVTFREPES